MISYCMFNHMLYMRSFFGKINNAGCPRVYEPVGTGLNFHITKLNYFSSNMNNLLEYFVRRRFSEKGFFRFFVHMNGGTVCVAYMHTHM